MQTYIHYVDKENQHCIFNIEVIHLLPILGSLPSCRERKKHLAAISKQVTFPEVLFLSSFSSHVYNIDHFEKHLSNLADVPDKVEGSSTPKRSRFDLESRHKEEKEYRSVRRSSRITRCKVNSPKQSVLYNRLITK